MQNIDTASIRFPQLLQYLSFATGAGGGRFVVGGEAANLPAAARLRTSSEC
ncbi:MAG: hypothetical protein KIT57_07980 [Blastocatellales bacterium]|nr:hypothetical protein [Blastocatellales bacterium]